MNIVKAVEAAKEKGMKVVGLTGKTGWLLAGMVDSFGPHSGSSYQNSAYPGSAFRTGDQIG